MEKFELNYLLLYLLIVVVLIVALYFINILTCI